MFDFFRDMYFEINGVDVETIDKEREKKREIKKKNKIIFSKKTKIIIYVLGILYLVMSGFNILTLKELGELSGYNILRWITLTICDVACLVCVSIKKKKTEIAALVLIIIFVLIQYFTVLLI